MQTVEAALLVQTVGAFSGADSGGFLRCGQWRLLSRCGQWGLLSRCGSQASLGSVSSCKHRLQGVKALVVGAHGLICSTICVIFSNQGLNLCLFIGSEFSTAWPLWCVVCSFFIHLLVFGCAESLLHAGFFSGCGERASPCGGFSRFGAQALGRVGVSSCGTWAQ